MSNDKYGGESHITVGDISNSTGVAVGPGAHAAVGSSRPEDEIRAQLAGFTKKLAFYLDDVDNASEVRQIAADALAESVRPEPKWPAVRRMLTAVAARVASIAALTEAIDNIQQLVSHLIG